jgi:hypothetical protein
MMSLLLRFALTLPIASARPGAERGAKFKVFRFRG